MYDAPNTSFGHQPVCLSTSMESLKEKTAKGLFWGALNNLLMQLIGVTVGIALGRLLDKTDYGMIAMISVFALVANELQNSGFKGRTPPRSSAPGGAWPSTPGSTASAR